jgi:hypothetical protein
MGLSLFREEESSLGVISFDRPLLKSFVVLASVEQKVFVLGVYFESFLLGLLDILKFWIQKEVVGFLVVFFLVFEVWVESCWFFV